MGQLLGTVRDWTLTVAPNRTHHSPLTPICCWSKVWETAPLFERLSPHRPDMTVDAAVRGRGAAQLEVSHECGGIPQRQVHQPLRPGRAWRWRPDHGASRLCLYRPRLFERHQRHRRARSEEPEARRLRALSA